MGNKKIEDPEGIAAQLARRVRFSLNSPRPKFLKSNQPVSPVASFKIHDLPGHSNNQLVAQVSKSLTQENCIWQEQGIDLLEVTIFLVMYIYN